VTTDTTPGASAAGCSPLGCFVLAGEGVVSLPRIIGYESRGATRVWGTRGAGFNTRVPDKWSGNPIGDGAWPEPR